MNPHAPPLLYLLPGVVLLLVALTSVARQGAPAVQVPSVQGDAPSVPMVPAYLLASEASTGPPPTAAGVRALMLAGRTERALPAAVALSRADRGPTGSAAALLAASLAEDAGRPHAAIGLLGPVAGGEGPLAAHATHRLARLDLAVGRPAAALAACERYLTRWAHGTDAGSCLAVIAFAHASLGQSQAALAAADRYDADHGDGIREQVTLAVAEAIVETKPAAAIALYRTLAIGHRTPLVGRISEQRLDALAAAGHREARLPDDDATAWARATSLRLSRRRDEAWAAFEDLRGRARHDAALAQRLVPEERTFAWHTWRWEDLEQMTRARINERPTETLAWDLVKVLGRSGRWRDASDEATRAVARWPGLNRRREEIARIHMLAGRWPQAVALFDTSARAGGWSGRRAAWLAAFATHAAGRHEEAITRFDKVLASSSTYAVEARYWRSRAADAAGRPASAAEDERWILTQEPDGWYAGLVRTRTSPGLGAPWARDGRWPGPELPDSSGGPPQAYGLMLPGIAAGLDAVLGPPTWTGPPAGGNVLRVPGAPPLTAPPAALFDEREAEVLLARFAAENASDWPELTLVYHLARVGHLDVAGPLMARVYGDRKAALRSSGHPRHHAALRARATLGEWRSMFLYAGDHHDVARFLAGSWPERVDPALSRDARRLAWPLAHARPVWANAEREGVDPYLVLGLMRQESTYDAVAISHAGARGAMQIMPRTGHLLADLSQDVDFATCDLEDPGLAVAYGIRYLGLLMRRFDGVYPLAVAAYNAGPHNVHAWLAGPGPDVTIDQFVELIPVKETNQYVKRVSAHYATYLRLYAPEGTQVHVPPSPRGDDPSVVDF